MRKVLFYYDNFCGHSSRGGTEVATYRIARALKDTEEIDVYHCYRNKCDFDETYVYTDTARLSHSSSKFIRTLKEFIIKNEIDVVVNMSRFFRNPLIIKAADSSGRRVKKIFMQHFAPGSEIKKSSFKAGLHLLRLNPYNPLYWLRSTIYPLIKLSRSLKYRKAYKDTYFTNDKIILLSEGYFREYKVFAGIEDSEKFSAISNIFELSEEEKSHISVTATKKKRVLILCRMDEVQKRLSLALKIWGKIETDSGLNEWHLDIVGKGHNSDIVKRLIKKLGLQRVSYHGWQDRTPFLKDASILMMTSEYEGQPLSVLEAQAYGCVPIAFNSFASLKDVVKSGVNGVVVEDFGDIENYTTKLKQLMCNSAYRENLSEKASQGADKFGSDKIVDQWLKILT